MDKIRKCTVCCCGCLFEPFLRCINCIKCRCCATQCVTVDSFEKYVTTGDIILSRTNGQLTNVLNEIINPGKYMHASIYVGDKKIVEAISTGVVMGTIDHFLKDKNNVAIVRAKSELMNSENISNAIKFAISKLGMEYDYIFDLNNEKKEEYYCSELVYYAYKAGNPNLPFITNFKNRGMVTPNDFYFATKYFEIIRCFDV